MKGAIGDVSANVSIRANTAKIAIIGMSHHNLFSHKKAKNSFRMLNL